MTFEEVISQLEESGYKISTESRLARVGLKDSQNISPIIEQYAHLYEPAWVAQVKAAWQKETNPAQRLQLKLLYFELAGGLIYRQVASECDRVTTALMQKKVKVGEEEIGYYGLQPRMVKTADFARREVLQDAMFGVVESVNMDNLQILQKETEIIAGTLGYASYLDFYSQQKPVVHVR